MPPSALQGASRSVGGSRGGAAESGVRFGMRPVDEDGAWRLEECFNFDFANLWLRAAVGIEPFSLADLSSRSLTVLHRVVGFETTVLHRYSHF